MKNIVLITIIWLLSNNLIAQNSVNIIGGGRSTEPSPAGLFAKNAEVCYDFPRTSYLASLIISHSDIKENGNVTQTAVFYQLSLHKLSVPKAIIAIGMDGVDCKFTAIDSKGFFMSNYTLRENLARVKVYAFTKKEIQYNTSVPIALIVNKNAKLSTELLKRVLSCTNTTDISQNDLQVLQQETSICRLFTYIIYKL